MVGPGERWVSLLFRVVRVGIPNFLTTTAGRSKRETIAFGKEIEGVGKHGANGKP
jgi:hypothetical protein